MANTTVTDALLRNSAAMTNTAGSKKTQTDGFAFADVMKDATSAGSKDAGVLKITDAGTDTKKLQEPVQKSESAGADKASQVKDDKSVDDNAKDYAEKADKTPDADAQKTDSFVKDVSKKAGEIKEEIKDALEVTDEDIEAVLSAMGLITADLLDPNNLKDVMMELSGIEDSMELLTNADAYDGMMDVLKSTQETVSELAKAYELAPEELISFTKSEDFTAALDGLSAGELYTGTEEDALLGDIKPEDNLTFDMQESDGRTSFKSKVDITVTRDDAVRTETFKNVTGSEEAQDAGDNNGAMMQNGAATVTTSVNELGQVVETVETFSSSFTAGEDIVSQVTQSIKLSFSSDTTSMELMLHPASLGTVNLQVSTQGGAVTAHLLVQNDAVKAALEGQMQTLIDTLKKQGQQVEAVEVSVANYDLNRGMNQNSDEKERENAFRTSRAVRRRLNLDELPAEEENALSDEERITADMMRRQGNSLDYMA